LERDDVGTGAAELARDERELRLRRGTMLVALGLEEVEEIERRDAKGHDGERSARLTGLGDGRTPPFLLRCLE
jgi:hypothetical protein